MLVEKLPEFGSLSMYELYFLNTPRCKVYIETIGEKSLTVYVENLIHFFTNTVKKTLFLITMLK